MLEPPSRFTPIWLPPVAVVVTLAATLIGCGGGGGDGHGRAPPSFGAVTPASIDFDIPQGVDTPWVTLGAPVGGETDPLRGKPLCVRVDDPLGLFEGGTLGWDRAGTRPAGLNGRAAASGSPGRSHRPSWPRGSAPASRRASRPPPDHRPVRRRRRRRR